MQKSVWGQMEDKREWQACGKLELLVPDKGMQILKDFLKRLLKNTWVGHAKSGEGV